MRLSGVTNEAADKQLRRSQRWSLIPPRTPSQKCEGRRREKKKKENGKKEAQEVASVTLRYPNRSRPPPAT